MVFWPKVTVNKWCKNALYVFSNAKYIHMFIKTVNINKAFVVGIGKADAKANWCQ